MTVEDDNKTKQKAAFYEIDTRVTRMVNVADGMRLSDAIKRAEANVESYKSTGLASIDEKVGELVEICARMRTEANQADERKAYLLSNDIFSAAGMFGQPELSEAAYSLCEMIGNRVERVPLSWEAVNVHVSTMRLLRQSGVDTDAAARVAVLEGLRKVTARILAEAGAAE